MKKLSTTITKLTLLTFIFASFSLLNVFGQEFKDGVSQNSIRIKLKPAVISSIEISPSTNKSTVSTGVMALDKLNSNYSVTEMKRVFPYSPKFEERHMKHGLHLWYEISINTKTSARDVVNDYSKLEEVDVAQPILEIKLLDGSSKPTYVTKSTLDETRPTDMPFTDPYLPKQWHYNNYGQSGGTIGSDINLFEAWNTTYGSPNVVIAVMDQGVDYKHEDLHNMMWVNEAELNGEKSVDDDGNGYKDDIYGVNFADNTGNINIDYHGTHVAGTIAAENNNGIGVGGVAGGSGNGDGVRVMTCQILGGSRGADIPNAYVYAADNGAVISQNSWGYSTPGMLDEAVHAGIDYFIAEAGNFPGSPMKGGVVFFASGNSNTEEMMYPGAYEPVIAVNALTSTTTRASYSNYGTWTDISAPGGDVGDDVELGADAGYSNGIMSTLSSNGYGFLDGTSMACPHVSGIAGLVVSKYGGPDFTNEMLKTHILTGVNYLYDIPENIELTGKLGVGYADAVLALKTDNKIAPNKITDLSMVGLAQDFATLSWSVPSDDDDGIPLTFEILYSKAPINAANIAQAKSLTLNNILHLGELQTFEITDLQSVTKYYFSIRSIDRWGNISGFSNELVGTTNSGPISSFDPGKTAINVVIDVTKKKTGIDSVKLINTGEGSLKWDVLSRVTGITPLSKRPDLQYPIAPTTLSSSLHIQEKALPPSALNNIQHDTLVDKGYVNEWVSLKVFGESNLSIPNSSATRFYVSEEDGFNFTFTEAYLQVDTAGGPIIVEVYEGYDIASAKLLLAQEVKAPKPDGYVPVYLNEQIYFEKGSYFWVVYHIPAGNKYPLGGGLELEADMSKNCYYSTNVGKTWQLFEDVYDDNRVVWAVFAVSTMQNVDEYLVISPNSGVVNSNQSVYISAEVDGTEMINGSYKSNLVVNTNETGKPMIRMPINVTITGHLPIIESPNRVDFGGVMLGTTRDVTVTLKNNGLGRFNFESPYCNLSNDQFTYISGVNTVFESGETQVLTFRFTPTVVGNVYSYVTLLDANGNNHKFQLFAAGLAPPVASLDPSSAVFNDLNLGDSITNSIYLHNDGTYPLDFFLPAYADGSNMESIPTNIQKYGYTFKVDTTGATYVWNDIVATGTEVTDVFKGNTSTNIYSDAIDLGFLFPFYGKYENSVHISKYGLLAFIANDYIWSSSPMFYNNWVNPDKYIAGCAAPMQFYDAGYGGVYYKREADKFIVQYEEAPYYEGIITVPDDNNNYYEVKTAITFQIILHDNGNIDIYYKENTWKDLWKWTLVGMEDQTIEDGILILGKYHKKYNDHIINTKYQDQSAIHISNPGLGLFSNISNPYGTVLPGDSAKIDYTIKTDSLYLLAYRENLVVVTNDPFNNPAIHTVDFNINSGGISDVTSDTAGFDFGTVFKNGVVESSFILSNSGKATDSIKTAQFDNGYYTLKGNIPEILKPERKLTYSISMNTETLGVRNDTLRLTTANGQEIKIGLSGEVVQGPIVNIQKTDGTALTSITKIITAGNSTTQSFKINNSGALDLNVGPVNNEWASMSENTPSVNEFPYTYKWKSSRDFGGPTYEWVEIADNGGTKITGLDSWTGPQWSEGIKLPFAFNFYENSYDTLYIGMNGIITFTKDQNEFGYYFSVGGIPVKGIPDNFIAPLFLFGGPDWVVLYPLAGLYYKIEEDRIIIEYKDYNSAFTMGDPISYQAILYKNGNIKFNYVMPVNTSNLVTNQGVIGIENSDGSDGVEISAWSPYVNSNMSVELFPVRTYVLAPGASKDFTMAISAKEAVAGVYADSIEFITNDPLALSKKLPVKMIVTGKPILTTVDSIDFGDVMVDSEVPSISKEFEIKNTGTDNFTITGLTQNLPTSVKIEMYRKSGESWYWNEISGSGLLPHTIVAKSSLKLKVTITPTVPVALFDTLKIVTNMTIPKYSIPIEAQIYNSPLVETSVDSINYYAETSEFKTTHKLIVSNKGGYPLNYQLSIDYLRDTSLTTQSLNTGIFSNKSAISNALLPKLNAINIPKSNNTLKALTTDNFTQVLAYDTATVPATQMGYGGSRVFYVGTGFTAPASGFNLSHVQTWYFPIDWLNSKIGVQIYGGDVNINNCKLLSEDVFEHNVESPDPVGSLLTFKLANSVEFFPNEHFYVVFVYESAVTYPQGCVTIVNDIPNRYVFGAGDGTWYDLSEYDDFSTLGWMVRAAEETSSKAPWVVLSSNDSSIIEPMKNDTLLIDFDAFNALNGDNYAKLKITSNDIKTPLKDVVLHLRRNRGPVFENTDKLSVSENGTLDFTVTVTDVEGNEFDVVLDSDYPFLSLISINESGSAKGFDFTPITKTLTLQYKPDYTCQGDNYFNLTSTDSYGNKETTAVTVNVKNVNRPPVSIETDTIRLRSYGNYKIINPSDVFEDPDNDFEIFEAVSGNSEVVTLFYSENSYLLMPMAIGNTSITFMVTDEYGAKATNTVQVLVTESLTGVTTIESNNVILYPNPTNGLVNLYLANDLKGEITLSVYNVNSEVVMKKDYTIHSNDKLSFDISSLPAGVYYVRWNNNDYQNTSKIIKL